MLIGGIQGDMWQLPTAYRPSVGRIKWMAAVAKNVGIFVYVSWGYP